MIENLCSWRVEWETKENDVMDIYFDNYYNEV